MSERQHRRLSPAQAEAVLRRAAELNADESRGSGSRSISPADLMDAADLAGIPEEQVRRALGELASGRSAEPRTLSRRLFGKSRVTVERELNAPAWLARERLEHLLRVDQGLKLRRGTESGSLWDAGDEIGVVRRALDFSGERPLLKARCIELLVDERPGGRSSAKLIADLYEQRGEHLSLAGILAATLSLPAAIAGVYEPLYLLAFPPALAVPGLGFKLAYGNARGEASGALEAVLEAVEEPEDRAVSGATTSRERHRGGTRERRVPRFSQRRAESRDRDEQRRG